MTIDSRAGFKQGVKTYSEPMRVGPVDPKNPPPPPPTGGRSAPKRK